MGWWLSEFGLRDIARRLRTRVLPNIRHIPKSRIRVCGACQKVSAIVAFGADEEFHICIRCRANLRFEMLAQYVREEAPLIEQLDILELDYRSPLRPMLQRARHYTPSYFRDNIPPGTVRHDGVVCQDITQLAMPDQSVDLIVSSDVLEHVPDFPAALRESRRVLRPGGAHVFTVPPCPRTQQRARITEGRVEHLAEPEYHIDPLSKEGVLAFWNFGPDLPHRFAQPGLAIRQARGPTGKSARIVWEAKRIQDPIT